MKAGEVECSEEERVVKWSGNSGEGEGKRNGGRGRKSCETEEERTVKARKKK